MSQHKNVTEGPLVLQVDSRQYPAEAGETVNIPDEFDYQVADQPAWELVKGKKETASAVVDPAAADSEGDK